MTKEEKAKAYDEALEKAKTRYDKESTDGYVGYANQILEELFPTLIESEDERIRKAILGLTYIDGIEPILTKCSITAQDIRKYLEKQKEQKPVEPSDAELQRHQDELYDFKMFATKQAKEHHISFVHDFEWNNFCAELLSYFNEKQKPAEWSEEDRDRVAQYLHDRDGGMLWSKATEITSDILDILRPRPSCKPSEDEERLINTSISFLKDFADKGYENAVECIDWLKSKLNGNTGK